MKEPNWASKHWTIFRCDGGWFIGDRGYVADIPEMTHQVDERGFTRFSSVFTLYALTLPAQTPDGQIQLRQHFETSSVLFLHNAPESDWRVSVLIAFEDLLEIDREQFMKMIQSAWQNMVADRAGQSRLVIAGKVPDPPRAH